MRRKHWIIILVVLAVVGYGAYAVLTGGLTYERIENFGGQRNIRLVSGLKSDIALDGKMTNFSIPLVFHYLREEKPFGIFLQIWDDEKKYGAIEIAEVLIDYVDGESIREKVSWSRQLRPYTAYNSLSGKLITTEMLQLGDRIDDIVKRHADVKITLLGHLEKVTGEKVSFQVSESFKAESRSRWGTWWEAIAGC